MKKPIKEKLSDLFKKTISFIANPRLVICLLIAWMITNGWSYVAFAVGTALSIEWLAAIGGAYLAFLWLPISPEKILTVSIALALLRILFPNDERTLGVLRRMLEEIKKKVKGTDKSSKTQTTDEYTKLINNYKEKNRERNTSCQEENII